MIDRMDNGLWGVSWEYRNDPVFDVVFEDMVEYPNGDRLPSIFITEPILNAAGDFDGTCVPLSVRDARGLLFWAA